MNEQELKYLLKQYHNGTASEKELERLVELGVLENKNEDVPEHILAERLEDLKYNGLL